jgi:hypothetical protein
MKNEKKTSQQANEDRKERNARMWERRRARWAAWKKQNGKN